MKKKTFDKMLKERNEAETAELKRRKIVKSRVMLFGDLVDEPQNGTCFGCLEKPALPEQAYCADCLQDIFSLRCICCGERLYLLDPLTGVLEKDTPDGDFCYRCTHNFGKD